MKSKVELMSAHFHESRLSVSSIFFFAKTKRNLHREPCTSWLEATLITATPRVHGKAPSARFDFCFYIVEMGLLTPAGYSFCQASNDLRRSLARATILIPVSRTGSSADQVRKDSQPAIRFTLFVH